MSDPISPSGSVDQSGRGRGGVASPSGAGDVEMTPSTSVPVVLHTSPNPAAPSPSVGESESQPQSHAFQNRVHPSSTEGEPDGPPNVTILTPIPQRGKRSSVFSGRPDDLHAPSPSTEPLDEDEAEDEEVGKSVFNRQRSIITYTASTHRLDLLIATFNVLVHIGTILTDLILLSDYSEHNQNVSATALAVIRIIVGIVELEFDYLHRGWRNGRWMMIPIIFFNGRIIIDYLMYVKDWFHFRNKEWANSDFRASVSFETFIGSLPSLIVQTYVIMVDPRPMQQSWTVAYVMTCLSITIDLLHHYKYVRTDITIYIAQFIKALISTGLRTVLVAQLLDTIGRTVMGWMVVSFLIGCLVYYGAYKYARKHDRDDPFEYGSKVLHASFGGLIAGTILFVSIPFAPSHSIYDWWLGYLMAEVKMAVENFIMLAVVLNSVHTKYESDLFYSVLAFTLVCYIGNLFACFFIHQHVRKQLFQRDIYSDTAIVKLFARFGKYFRETYYPNSLEKHGSEQNHLMYKDSTGKEVHEHLQFQHDAAVKRSMMVRKNSAEAPLPGGQPAF